MVRLHWQPGVSGQWRGGGRFSACEHEVQTEYESQATGRKCRSFPAFLSHGMQYAETRLKVPPQGTMSLEGVGMENISVLGWSKSVDILAGK